jgi:hypothetical protein
VKALAKLEALRDMMHLRDYVDEGPVGKRRLPRLSKEDLKGPAYRDDEDEIDDEDALAHAAPIDEAKEADAYAARLDS